MKIAVFVDDKGRTEVFNTQGKIRVYEKQEGKWSVVDEFECEVDHSQGMAVVRKQLTEILENLGACHVIVGNKIIGLAYNILDRGGMHIWEFTGEPSDFLDIVEQKERESELMQSGDGANSPYIELSDGRYFVNVKNILLQEEQATSKKILKPFLEEENFYELHAVFSHIPPWLGPFLESKKLKMDVEAETVGEVQVIIAPKVCNEVN